MRVNWTRWKQRATRWGRRAVVLVLLVLLLTVAVTTSPGVAGYSESYVVDSTSAGAVGPGDVVLLDPVRPDTLEAGDVVTVHNPAEDAVAVRRVVAVDASSGEVTVASGGDGSEGETDTVSVERVGGVVAVTLPGLGHLFSVGETTAGRLTLVGVPALLILVNELYRRRAGEELTLLDWPPEKGGEER